MKFVFAVFIAVVVFGAMPARAQQDADDQYLTIYALMQQADNLGDSGQPRQALGQYTEIKNELLRFQRIYPGWNPQIISFRLKYLDGKIADMTARLPVVTVRPQSGTSSNSAPSAAAGTSEADLTALRGQVRQLQADNTALAAKLKEALSVQPTAIDSRELVRARAQVESLTKQNDVLKATLAENRTRTNVVTVSADAEALKQARAGLEVVNQKLAVETGRAERLALENLALQSKVQSLLANPDSLEAMRAENALLKRQIADLKVAAARATNATRIEDDMKQAKLQMAAFQSQMQIEKLEKTALEQRLRRAQATGTAKTVAVVPAPAPGDSSGPALTGDEKRIRELTQERDGLQAKLDEANKKLRQNRQPASTPKVDALTEEINVLRSRLAVDEAKPVPYTTEELALFRSSPPQENVVPQKKSVAEMPAGSAALVAEAQSFFAARQYDRAETNYLEMLRKNPDNPIVLGNLAAIEIEEGKLGHARQHLQAALKQNPDDAYNLSRLGFLEYQQGNYDDALNTLSRAAKEDPQNPEIQNYLGVTLSHKGLRVQAETALRRAVQINPNYAEAQNNLAVIYLTEQPPLIQLARWHYQKALDAGQPHNPELEKALGMSSEGGQQ